WRAIRPVSRVRVFPPHSSDTVLVLNMFFPSRPATPYCAAGPAISGQAVPVRCGALYQPQAPSPDCEGCHMRKRRLLLGAAFAKLLLSQTQLLDQSVVPLDILLLEICEQATALVDHHQQAAARMVVLVVILEMLGEVADPFGQDRDLNFGRSRVVLVTGIALDNLLLLFGGNRHLFHSAVSGKLKPLTTFAVPDVISSNATGTFPAVAQ